MKLKEKKINYYDEFYNNALIAEQITKIVKNYTRDFDASNIPKMVEEVHKLENEADDNLNKILTFLAKDFLPPIEREDVFALSNKIDDMIDFLDEIVINMDILNIEKLRNEFNILINIICILSRQLVLMFQTFKDIKYYEEAHKYIIEINKEEENGDKVFEKAIKELYKNEKNSIEIIKWNILYNSLEECIDSYKKIATTIDEIVLKNT